MVSSEYVWSCWIIFYCTCVYCASLEIVLNDQDVFNTNDIFFTDEVEKREHIKFIVLLQSQFDCMCCVSAATVYDINDVSHKYACY